MTNSRRKGHDFEREMVRAFRELLPNDSSVCRGLQYRDGAEVPDVVTEALHVECKRGRKPNPRAALTQACRDCDDKRKPIAVIKDDRAEPFVVMGWATFVHIVRNGVAGV